MLLVTMRPDFQLSFRGAICLHAAEECKVSLLQGQLGSLHVDFVSVDHDGRYEEVRYVFGPQGLQDLLTGILGNTQESPDAVEPPNFVGHMIHGPVAQWATDNKHT